MAARTTGTPLRFVLLVFALSVPFWILGATRSKQLLPGLPVSALQAVCPLVAASVLVYGENGIAGLSALLKRALDYRRITPKAWYLPIVLLMPGLTVVAYALMRALGEPLPEPHFAIAAAPGLFLGFFVLALTEELGWSAYATERMQERWSALRAGILLGLVWAVWHVVPLAQAHRAPGWIAWWCLGTVASRVIIVWLYNNAGRSVVAASLYHAVSNLCWQLFPNSGSHYDPRFTGVLSAVTAGIVTILWGPRTLARFRPIRVAGR